ncbi:hypothetical protein B0J13DRAFT_558642 [Dactylonectria estremocensis]|uniref:Uncharacterized protein n=1 Tax=Dactylonectria estremocensis TaxID=1079267 RepID=A0A9P9J3G5_9HYPO|nr:hypothetical protein B0J13DRAFT_558642 [Dactylonectria estremocensis]
MEAGSMVESFYGGRGISGSGDRGSSSSCRGGCGCSGRSVGVAATLSTPVLLASGAAAVVVLYAGYHLLETPSSSEQSPNNPTHESKDEDHPFGDREPKIPKKKMKQILEIYGKKIRKKLKTLSPDKRGTIWKNRDYRIDVGSRVRNKPNLRIWNLQVNGKADSVESNLVKGNAHQKLFWNVFDMNYPPDLEDLLQSILEHFS